MGNQTATTFDWSTVAGAWDAHSQHVEQTKRATTEAMLRLLAPRPGEEILELGAGTGEFGIRVAEAVGPGGRVLVSDAAQGMVEIIRRRASGRDNIDVRTIDAQRLPFDASAFDGITCRMGYMFVPDPATAFSEALRCLRPGGRLVFATWAGPQHNAWALCLGMAAMQHGVVPPGNLFSLSDATLIRSLLSDAGFREVAIKEAETPFIFEDFHSYWNTVPRLAGPLADALAQRTRQERIAIRETAREIAARHQTEDGLRLAGRALVTAAR